MSTFFFKRWFGELNSGPHACERSTLLIRLFLDGARSFCFRFETGSDYVALVVLKLSM